MTNYSKPIPYKQNPRSHKDDVPNMAEYKLHPLKLYCLEMKEAFYALTSLHETNGITQSMEVSRCTLLKTC
jgi:hypothetical protein